MRIEYKEDQEKDFWYTIKDENSDFESVIEVPDFIQRIKEKPEDFVDYINAVIKEDKVGDYKLYCNIQFSLIDKEVCKKDIFDNKLSEEEFNRLQYCKFLLMSCNDIAGIYIEGEEWSLTYDLMELTGNEVFRW